MVLNEKPGLSTSARKRNNLSWPILNCRFRTSRPKSCRLRRILCFSTWPELKPESSWAKRLRVPLTDDSAVCSTVQESEHSLPVFPCFELRCTPSSDRMVWGKHFQHVWPVIAHLFDLANSIRLCISRNLICIPRQHDHERNDYEERVPL